MYENYYCLDNENAKIIYFYQEQIACNKPIIIYLDHFIKLLASITLLPEERIKYIIDNSDEQVIITSSKYARSFSNKKVINLDNMKFQDANITIQKCNSVV